MSKPSEVKCPVSENLRGHENIEWSIGYAFHLTDDMRDLPRAMLVGDSICNAYQPVVRELLEGRMNVSYWASSYCVTSPNFLRLLDFYLEETPYDVVHFNNGLHSLGTPTADWARALDRALRLVRERQPAAKIVWVTSTPLVDSEKTAKCRELNDAAKAVIDSIGGIATDDLFALLDPLDRAANWTDCYHHAPATVRLEATQVAKTCMGSWNLKGPML